MAAYRQTRSRMIVTEAEEFIANPPTGFVVEDKGSSFLVHSDADQCLVLIDDFDSSRGRVAFENSRGSKVNIRDLWQYTSMRKSLVSRRIYLLTSLCEKKQHVLAKKSPRKSKKKEGQMKVLKRFVLSIDGNDPYITWQLEKGLDWTIATVLGESYKLEIDLTDEVQSWALTNVHIRPANKMITFVWRGAIITLKYYSDALFDFPHWFGCSKRKFKLMLT